MDIGPKNNTSNASSATVQKKPLKPGVSDYLAGEARAFEGDLTPFLPSELVGGSVPHIPGREDEMVWNAASQACATEKVHYVYSVEGDRCWYLACSSSSLASDPDTWCPLAAALPGNSEFWDKETVYLYEQEGMASALRWDAETGRMQVFLGAARTVLPRIQSMDANFVTVNAEMADVQPWKNKSLRTEQLSRATVRMLFLTGLLLNIAILLLLSAQYIMVNNVDRRLGEVKAQTNEASSKLMLDAYRGMQNDVIKHMVKAQKILDDLRQIDGTLVKYEVGKDGKVHWEALVPPQFAPTIMTDYSAKVSKKREKDGRDRVVGNR